MADASLTLQQAIYGALVASPTLGAAVYDAAPQAAAFPHIEIGSGIVLDWSAATLRGEEHRVDVHVWSRYRGMKELKTLMAAVKARLHEQTLTLTSNALVDLRYSDESAMIDADGLTRHGIIRFRALTSKT
jgi:hypothetical protein